MAKLSAWVITQLRGDDAANTSSHEDTHVQIGRIAIQHAADVPTADIEQLAANLRSGTPGASRRMIH